ncbi:MAG: helix-turn-helix transcriptional regulator [Enterocloster clostridioformis]|nr:helix-turn-helix transcriptional regulator [Enterocloster clostridioformis]
MDVEIIFHIKEVREEKKITLRELSEKSGISKSEINFIENGQREPTLHTVCLLSLALGVQPEKLFTVKVKR